MSKEEILLSSAQTCSSLISGQTESVTSSQGQDRTHQLSILIICKIASLINPIPRVVYNFNEWKCWWPTKEVTRLIKSDLIRSDSNQLRKLFGTRRRTRDTADIIIIDLNSWELPKDRPCIKWQIKGSSPFNYVKMALENSKQKQFSIREFVDLRWSWTEKYIYQINIRMHDPPTTTSMAERGGISSWITDDGPTSQQHVATEDLLRKFIKMFSNNFNGAACSPLRTRTRGERSCSRVYRSSRAIPAKILLLDESATH